MMMMVIEAAGIAIWVYLRLVCNVNVKLFYFMLGWSCAMLLDSIAALG